MDKFRNRYRIPSTRLQQWDYGWNAAYFITICTKDRHHYFGEVVQGKMVLSGIGIIADILWHEITNHAENIELGAFVVMPNHVHGIIIIKGHPENGPNDSPVNTTRAKNDVETMHAENDVETTHAENDVETTHAENDVETTHALSLHPGSPVHQTIGQTRFQHQGRNTISSMVGSYKSAVTKHAHRLRFSFAWQSRFYDHIIRNERAFHTISDYIINNPEKWDKDKFRASV